MPDLTKKDFQQLIETTNGPCISIFMPTHRFGVETLQDPVRLKNLLRTVERNLGTWGLKSGVIDEILAPVHELLGNYNFWQHQANGLAIFCSPGMFRLFRVPLRLPELAIVAERFHLKPLLPLVTRDDRFYVLALSQSQVKLFLGTREAMQEVEVEDLPQAVNGDQEGNERFVGVHTAGGTRTGSRGAILHGTGAGEEDRKEGLESHFRRVDRALRPLLSLEDAPLVLATVDYLNAMYRRVNSYRRLLDTWIPGNFDRIAAEELHSKVLPVLLDHFAVEQRRAAAHFLELEHTDRTSSELNRVLPAAYRGQVEVLLVAVGVQSWGRFAPETGEVEAVERPGSADQDLLNLAALYTYLAGGAVFAVGPEAVPGNGPLAAILRY